MKFDNMDSFLEKCIEISEQGTDIFIVCAGVYGKKIAEILDMNQIKWKCFVDKLKTGKCMDKPIITYEECKNRGGILYYFIYRKV